MLNHFRTLLLNVAGEASEAVGRHPGDEAVPRDFLPMMLPSWAGPIRTVLFGASPDRFMLNWRARQLLTVLHTTPLAPYVTALDGRITYSTGQSSALASPYFYGPRVRKTEGDPTTELSVVGLPEPPDASGQAYGGWRVTTPSDGTADVMDLQTGRTLSYELADGPAALTNGLTVRLQDESAGQAWTVEVYRRPERDVGQLLAGLTSLGQPIALEVFGIVHDEPFTTFWNYWRLQAEVPLRLAAFLCAYVYRLDAWRTGV